MGQMRTAPPRTVRRHHLALFAVPITSGFDHFRFRSLPVSITSGFDHFRFPTRTFRRPTAPTHGPPFAASPHSSPPSLPVPITSGSDHFRFPPRTLRRPVPDLGLNVSDNIRCDVINSYLLTCLIWGLSKRAYLLLAPSTVQSNANSLFNRVQKMRHVQYEIASACHIIPGVFPSSTVLQAIPLSPAVCS